MRYLIVCVIAVGLIVAKMFWPTESPQKDEASLMTHTPPAVTDNTSENNKAENLTVDNEAKYKALVLAQLPPSLTDVGEPATLSTTSSGELIVDDNLRKLADFYLSALGEEPLKDVMLRIEHAINKQLTPSEAEKAFKLVKGYVDFKQQLGNRMEEFQTMWTEGLSLDAIIAVREKINAERAQFLPLDAIEAFFGREDAYNEFSNQRHIILTNDDLTDIEKQQQLNTLVNQQPDWLREQQQPSQQIKNYQAYQTAIENVENKEQLIEEYRQEQFDPETNARLKALDRQRERWKQRLKNYMAEKQSLVAFQDDATLYNEKLNELKQACFTQPEILRVEALERLGKI